MDKIKVLLVSGVLTAEHDFRRMNNNLCKMLESTGRFEVRVNEEFNGCTAATLQDYDMIFLNYDGKNMPTDAYKRWNADTEKLFFDFVKSGKGLVVHHSAVWIDTELPQDYRDAWGYHFTTLQGRRNPCDDVAVKVMDEEHPIMRGLEDFFVVGDDFFAGAELTKGTQPHVLAAVYDDVETYRRANFPPKHHPVEIPGGRLENMPGVNTWQPVAWTNHFGEGRVFACSLGHDIDTFRRVSYLTMLMRGCEWAATDKVTIDRPDRSGERRFRPWPFY